LETDKSNLKLTFIDILKGFSKASYEKNVLYIKHNTTINSGDIDYKKQDFERKAIQSGLPTKKEKENYLIKENLWSIEKNEKIEKIKKNIFSLKQTKSKIFKIEDIKYINKSIEKEEKDLKELLTEFTELLGFTVEDYANKKINEYFMFISLYKDIDLNEKFFSQEEFEDLENFDITKLVFIYNGINLKFSEQNLKKIALSSFYLNIFNLSSDNPYYLYGKPIIDLTFYQMEIFSFARYFKNVVSNSKHSPPEEYYNEPDKLIEWLETSKNADEMIEKNDTQKTDGTVATSIIGAKKEDLAKIGADKNVISLHDVAQQKGGVLTMEDLMKLHGQ